MTFPRITVGGDAEHGWMVDIHDGDKCVAYSPVAATPEEARAAAMKEHGLPEEAPPAASPAPAPTEPSA